MQMFDGSVLTRRLRLRRLRRSTAGFARHLDGVVGRPDFNDVLSELCVWATGMPWVVESSRGARQKLKLFMLDCTPLSCREPWFAINEVDNDTEDVPGIVVILKDT